MSSRSAENAMKYSCRLQPALPDLLPALSSQRSLKAAGTGKSLRTGSLGRRLFLMLLCVLMLAAGSGCGQDPLEQGLAAQKARKHDQAVELLGRVVQQSPQNPEAWRARALSLIALERRPEALSDLSKGLDHNPKNIPLMVAKGKVLGELERHGEAIAVFTEVMALDPKNAEAYKERAENYVQEGELDQARADITRAVDLAPTDPWAYFKLGMVEFALNHHEAAVKAFSAAIRLNPDAPLFYFSRGQMYLRHLNRPDQARADFAKGCSLGHPLCCQELEGMKAGNQKP
jgi:tetratricopeptide (TPR) repeat protein